MSYSEVYRPNRVHNSTPSVFLRDNVIFGRLLKLFIRYNIQFYTPVYKQESKFILLVLCSYRALLHVVENNQHYTLIVPILYLIYWLLHVSAVVVGTQLWITTNGTTTLRHTGHITTHYMIYHLFDLYFM
jgi:hypothetical protein